MCELGGHSGAISAAEWLSGAEQVIYFDLFYLIFYLFFLYGGRLLPRRGTGWPCFTTWRRALCSPLLLDTIWSSRTRPRILVRSWRLLLRGTPPSACGTSGRTYIPFRCSKATQSKRSILTNLYLRTTKLTNIKDLGPVSYYN